MGANAVITLKHGTRVRDVATAMAILNGGRAVQTPFSSSGDGWFTTTEGVECLVRATSIVECAELEWHDGRFQRINGSGRGGYCLYHFEGDGGRVMLPSSTALWIAIGRALVMLFGGSIQYNDYSDSFSGLKSKGRWAHGLAGEDGKGFYANQTELLNLKPLTMGAVKRCEKYAAYPETLEAVA